MNCIFCKQTCSRAKLCRACKTSYSKDKDKNKYMLLNAKIHGTRYYFRLYKNRSVLYAEHSSDKPILDISQKLDITPLNIKEAIKNILFYL